MSKLCGKKLIGTSQKCDMLLRNEQKIRNFNNEAKIFRKSQLNYPSFLQFNTASKYQIEELMNCFLSSNKVVSFFLFHHGFKKIDFASSICHNQVQGSEMKEVIGPQSKSWRQPARPFPASTYHSGTLRFLFKYISTK